MKILLTIECEEDGKITDKDAVGKWLAERLPGVIVSEDVNGTDDWALVIDTVSWEIKDND